MALPDYIGLIPGTTKTWKSSGGDHAITLTSLANGSGREGAKGDFYDGTYGYPELLAVRFETSVASAATNGYQIELYAGESDSGTAGTNNPGNLTGADAALSSPDELKWQCKFVGALILSNARGTNIQKQWFLYYPFLRYWIPLVVNKSGQALGSTAGDHQIVVTPYYRKLQD